MPNENNKISKYNHGEKSMEAPFVIDDDLESLLVRIDTCHNNSERPSATKINKYKPSGYSMFTHCSFDATRNTLDFYRGKESKQSVMNYKRNGTTN